MSRIAWPSGIVSLTVGATTGPARRVERMIP